MRVMPRSEVLLAEGLKDEESGRWMPGGKSRAGNRFHHARSSLCPDLRGHGVHPCGGGNAQRKGARQGSAGSPAGPFFKVPVILFSFFLRNVLPPVIFDFAKTMD